MYKNILAHSIQKKVSLLYAMLGTGPFMIYAPISSSLCVHGVQWSMLQHVSCRCLDSPLVLPHRGHSRNVGLSHDPSGTETNWLHGVRPSKPTMHQQKPLKRLSYQSETCFA